jgi:hypothetical protein
VLLAAVERNLRTLVGLPVGRLHDLGGGRALGPSNQFPDLGSLALGLVALVLPLAVF